MRKLQEVNVNKERPGRYQESVRRCRQPPKNNMKEAKKVGVRHRSSKEDQGRKGEVLVLSLIHI